MIAILGFLGAVLVGIIWLTVNVLSWTVTRLVTSHRRTVAKRRMQRTRR